MSHVSTLTNIQNIFFGVPQSRYAALALLLSLIIVYTIIIFDNDASPISSKFKHVFIILLISLPGLALAFLQLTCIVTGAGTNNNKWWCNIYAWLLCILIIFNALCFVTVVLISVKNKDEFANGSPGQPLLPLDATISKDDAAVNAFQTSNQLTMADILNNSF